MENHGKKGEEIIKSNQNRIVIVHIYCQMVAGGYRFGFPGLFWISKELWKNIGREYYLSMVHIHWIVWLGVCVFEWLFSFFCILIIVNCQRDDKTENPVNHNVNNSNQKHRPKHYMNFDWCKEN